LRKSKLGLALAMMLVISGLLGACGTDKGKDKGKDEGTTGSNEVNENAVSVAMVTDTGGVDDKSFNQSAWKGIEEFGKENGLEKGDEGYDYLESNDASEYEANLNRLVRRDFDVVYGIGFLLKDAIETIAEQNPDTMFGLVDEESEVENVASIMFKEQEGAFLAGAAAALMTKSDKIGFVGGMEIPVIERFHAGFIAGVAAVKPDIKVDVQYTGNFDKAEDGKAAANRMYTSGVDIIFHAAGGTGNGVFSEAKERKSANPDEFIWVIGVDSDQYEEGQVGDHNITLTSMLKRVDLSVISVAELAAKDEFPGGEITRYGIAEGMIELADSRGAIPQDVLDKIDELSKKIVDGEIEVPEDPKQ
jgi:basic membrane protein A and related proteins